MNVDNAAVQIGSCHHVALRCRDAEETVEFYTNVLGLKFRIAARENHYRGKSFNFLHIFLQMKDGNFVAFFELPGLNPQACDPNTPIWVQHCALRVENADEVAAAKAAVEARGIHVDGPVVRPPFTSIYFADPSGNRIEVTAVAPLDGTRFRLDDEGAMRMLRQWQADKSGGALDNPIEARQP